MKSLTVITTILLMLLHGSALLCCWATTYHVSAKIGSNNNNGTSEERPFKTIKKAVEVAGPGDKVLIYEGVYHEEILGGRSGEEGRPIVFEGTDREKVILQGSVHVKDWRKEGKQWVKRGLKSITPGNSFVMVDDKRMLTKVDSPIDLPAGSYYLHPSGEYRIRLRGEADPNRDHKVEVYELNLAFHGGDRWGGTSKKWIVLRNLTLEKYGAHPISTSPNQPADNAYWELDRLIVRYNNNEGVFHCLDDWYVHDCTFIRNRGHGCQIDGARVRFENNLCAENEWFGPYVDGGCGLLIGPDGWAHSAVVRNNILVGNGDPSGYGCGIYLEGPAHHNLIESNLIQSNTPDGIGIFGSSHNIIVNNIIVNTLPGTGDGTDAAFLLDRYTGAPPGEGHPEGNLIAHNTIWRCPGPIAVLKDVRVLPDAEPNRFVNNFFGRCKHLWPLPHGAEIVLEGNAWYACPEGSGWTRQEVKNKIKEIFGKVVKGGVKQFDSGPLTLEEPGLENPEHGDFRLRQDSPLIDAGVHLPEVKQDREGTKRPYGASPDVGAYEYAPGR